MKHLLYNSTKCLIYSGIQEYMTLRLLFHNWNSMKFTDLYYYYFPRFLMNVFSNCFWSWFLRIMKGSFLLLQSRSVYLQKHNKNFKVIMLNMHTLTVFLILEKACLKMLKKEAFCIPLANSFQTLKFCHFMFQYSLPSHLFHITNFWCIHWEHNIFISSTCFLWEINF